MQPSTTMMDSIIRIGLILLGGFALVTATAWYLRLVYQELRGTGEVVIDPFTVVDDSGKGNEELGKALAQMLQARLESLAAELRDAQANLTASSSPGPATGTERVGDVRLWTQDVALKSSLLQPVEMKLAVGGVEVGGVIPWLQRRLSTRRTLHFTVYARADQAQVFGSVAALRLKGTGVRLVVSGAEGKPPPLDLIVDHLAHEVVRRWLAEDPSNRVELLAPEEFVTLASAMVSAADANRRALLGRPAQKEFTELLPRVAALSDQVPDWPELCYFTGWIADKARDSATATTYYGRVLAKLDPARNAELVALIKGRLGALAEQHAVAAAVAIAPEPLRETVDYSSDVKVVRDSGSEGSVVGQAMATALEVQIARTLHQEHRLSARYIYYAAREVSGTTELDSGATLKDAIRVLGTKGAVEEQVWPYVPGQFAAKPPPGVETARRFRIADAKSLSGIEDVKRALSANGPVVAAITMFQSGITGSGKHGVIPLPGPKAQPVGGHALTIVGYDDVQRRFKFVNSWGPAWGEAGFGYLPYEYFEKYASETWTFRLAPG